MGEQTEQKDVVLSVKNVSYAYGDYPIVRDVSFEVYRGEMFFIVGANGSGKTTLLRVCTRLLKPETGTVEIKSAESQGDIHVSVGIVLQQHGLISSMSVYDNVALPLRYHTNLDEEAIRKRVENALRSAGALDMVESKPDYLNLGMQRRVGVARAMVLHPDIIFYDDPVLGLDHKNASAVADLIRKTREDHGVTSVVISHSLALASALGTRIAVVCGGTIRDIGTLEDLRRSTDAETVEFIRSHDALWLRAVQ